MSRESIRARVAAATEGPWYSEPETELLSARVGAEGHRRGVGDYAFAFLDDTVRPEQGGAEWDGPFISHARQDIPALLAVADAVAKAAEWSGTGRARGGSKVRVLYIDDWDAIVAALAALEDMP